MLKGPILKKIKLYIIELFFEKHHKIFSIEKISVFEKKIRVAHPAKSNGGKQRKYHEEKYQFGGMSTKMIRTCCYTILIIYEYVEFYLVKKR
jgi:hypothetical protein